MNTGALGSRWKAWGLVAALALGCSGPRESEAPATAERGVARPAAAPALWTSTFLERAALAAAVVEVEGPELLRERIAVRRDEYNHEHSERAASDGYLIEQRQRADSDGTPIRVQLDELVIDADERVTIRIRPDAPRVVVRASGDVFMRVISSGRETRTAALTLVGELDTPLEP